MARFIKIVKSLSLSMVVGFGSMALPEAQAKETKKSTASAKKSAGKKPTNAAKSDSGAKTRERHVNREAKVTKDKKNIDFEEAQLYGERKVPPGSMVNLGKADKDFDLIRIRRRWHPEMVQSTSSLESGR